MLLSCGTSRHSGIDSPGERLLTLLGSAGDETIISRLSWPSHDGIHSNGPTTTCFVSCGGTSGAFRLAVSIGCQSFGQTSPVDGLPWKPSTTTFFAALLPRFPTLTYAWLTTPAAGRWCVVPPSARRRFQIAVAAQKVRSKPYSPLRPSSM